MANTTYVGLFDDRDAAQNAVQDLVNAGVDRSNISIVASDASTGGTTSTDAHGNLAAEGASAGISSGAVVGGVAGLLIGLGFTVLPIAGFLLAGPIAGLIAGAAAGAATGGVVGGLIGLGIPEEHAGYYAEGVRRGGTLVTVTADASMDAQVCGILDRDGAVDIDERAASWRESGYTGYDANAKPFNDAEVADERVRYATSAVNSDWNDTSNAPAPSADDTYASGSTYGTDVRSNRVRTYGDSSFDDTSYRTHFAQNNYGGNYDEYAPAYRYGRDLSGDATYSDDWDANEPAFRTRWEERNPGTWDRFKANVRHGWDEAKNAVTGGKDGNRATLY